MKKIFSYFLCTLKGSLLFSFLNFPLYSISQSSVLRHWSVNPYDEKVFIENKGQYADVEQTLQCRILFCLEQGNTTFFLCKNEFIVRQRGEDKTALSKEDETDPAQSHYYEPSFTYQRFIIEQANSDFIVSPDKKSFASNNYSLQLNSGISRTIQASLFQEVVYKNIYNGIDMIFSAHEKRGLKYQYVIHPFADAGLIGLGYSGAGRLFLDENNDLHAGVTGAEIIDHAPQSFYLDNHQKISSGFYLNGNASYIHLDNYDHSRTVIIDPWVINPNFTSQNIAFDIARDSIGNVFVFGGLGPWKLKKFDPNGNLIWTFNTTYNQWYGALAVDQRGNSFITEGCCGGNIQEIDSTGNVRWTRTYGTQEFWRLLFTCDYSRLYMAMGYASSGLVNESISILDTTNGNINNSTLLFGSQSEPRALSIGPNGNAYTMTCNTGTDSNQVACMSPAFVKLFSYSDGYSLLYNGPLYANGGNTTSGQNGIACGRNFFCTTNGGILYKRDLSNGAILASAIIPGGGTEMNSGILIDNCHRIYVGSSNAVIEFDSTLNVVSTTPTPAAVYCLASGKNGELLACGNGFVASLALSTCGGFCDSVLSTPLAAHFTSSDTAFCSETGECINFFDHSTGNPTSWQWFFPGANPDTSSLQNPDSICYYNTGTYPVTLVVSNGISTDTLAVSSLIIYANPPLPPTVTVYGGDTLVSSYASTYQWYYNGFPLAGATDSFYVAMQGGTYAVRINDSLGCSVSSNGVLITGLSPRSFGWEQGARLFPNPVSDELTLSFNGLTANTTEFIITDIVGKEIEVISRNISSNEMAKIIFSVKNLSDGMYFLYFRENNPATQKFIVMHK